MTESAPHINREARLAMFCRVGLPQIFAIRCKTWQQLTHDFQQVQTVWPIAFVDD